MNEDQKYRIALLKAREAFKTEWVKTCKALKIVHEEDYIERQMFMGCCGFLATKHHLDIIRLVQTDVFQRGGAPKSRSETKDSLAELLMAFSQELDAESVDLSTQMMEAKNAKTTHQH